MQIVTLEKVKEQLRITFNARDAELTTLTLIVEAEVLQYLEVPSYAAFLEHWGTDTIAVAPVEGAVYIGVYMRTQDMNAVIIKEGGAIVNLLRPFRAPGIGRDTA